MDGDDKVKYKKYWAKLSFVLKMNTCSLTAHFSCGNPSNAIDDLPVYAPSLYKRTSPLRTIPRFNFEKYDSLIYFSPLKSYMPNLSIFSAPILGIPSDSAPPLGLEPVSISEINCSNFDTSQSLLISS